MPLGAGIRAIIHKKSKTRLDVSFANIYTGIKHEIDGMIGNVFLSTILTTFKIPIMSVLCNIWLLI